MENKFNSQPEVNVIDSLFAEIVLDQALLDFQKQMIKQKIDLSLQHKNKKEFLRLTEQLNNVS